MLLCFLARWPPSPHSMAVETENSHSNLHAAREEGGWWALSCTITPHLLTCLFTSASLPSKKLPAPCRPSSLLSTRHLASPTKQICPAPLLATFLLSSIQLYILLVVNQFALLSIRIYSLYIQYNPSKPVSCCLGRRSRSATRVVSLSILGIRSLPQFDHISILPKRSASLLQSPHCS